MVNRNWMLGGNPVEIADLQGPLVPELGVVVEVASHPRAWRSSTRLCAKLFDDTVDGGELDLERVPDEGTVQQHGPTRVRVSVDEAGDDRQALCIGDSCSLCCPPFHVG